MRAERASLTRARTLLEETSDELYEQAPCGYVSTLPDGTIIRLNAWLTRVLGRRKSDLVGLVRLQELLTIGGRIYYETHVAPLLRMQDHVEEIALELRGANGPVPVLLNAVLNRDDDGEPVGIRASVLDVTERRRYEKELLAARNEAEEAARRKSTLVSMISHDIRTPLSTVLQSAELLQMTDLSEPQARYLRLLRSSAQNILVLMDHVLNLGRLETGHAALEREIFDLDLLLQQVTDEQRLVAEQKGLYFELTRPDDLPRVAGDPIKLGRVLTNLLSNAVKFTADGGVALRVECVGATEDRVRFTFTVADTGIGIPSDRVAHIFDDFTQASAEIGSRYGGSGLGLGICKRLLALHGTALEVETEVGRGTTFRFELEFDAIAEPQPTS